MILCHKCQGVLSCPDNQDDSGLSGCRCISGWVRGWEPIDTRETAIAKQIADRSELIVLYARQGRSAKWIADCKAEIR